MPDPLERITNLLALLLETRQPLTLAEISDRLVGLYPDADSARRTAFERDKALLRSEGIPIEQTVLTGDQAGQTAYRIDRRRYELGDLELTDDERNVLQLAVATVQLGTDWGEQAIWKLGGSGSHPAQPPSLSSELPSSPVLPIVSEAIAGRATVGFEYRGQRRSLDPYSLLARSGLWYLVGFDRDKNEVRTYRIDRIESAVSAGPAGAFERPEGFDPRTVFATDTRAGGEREAGASHAEVWIAAGRAGQVTAELGEAAVLRRDPDGSIVARVPCTNLVSFRSWVIELLDQAEVLGPPELRAVVVDWLEAIG